MTSERKNETDMLLKEKNVRKTGDSREKILPIKAPVTALKKYFAAEEELREKV